MILVIALIVYGSLYPWHFHLGEGVFNPFTALWNSWNGRLNRGLKIDALVNFLLYFPVGACAFLALAKSKGKLVAAVCGVGIGFLLSFSVEIGQYFAESRNSNLLDVIANTAGAAGGVALGAVFSRYSSRSRTSVDTSAALVLACWLASLLFPLWPVTRLQTVGIKVLTMLRSNPLQTVALASAFASWYVAGFLLLRAGARRPERWLALLLMIIPAQLLIVMRQPSLAHLLGGATGAVAFTLSKRQRLVPAFVFLAAVLLQGLSPFRWQPHPGDFAWLPFQALLESHWQNAILVLLDKTFYAAAAIWVLTYAGLRLNMATTIAASLLLLIEIGQTMLPGRTPEITDPILAALIGISIDAFRRTSSPSGTSA